LLVEILTAFSLVLVIEGLLPSINPDLYKAAMKSVLEIPSRHLRLMGLSSMIAGVVVLTLVR
jgi:uncharacterized protein YjeT (DUF2065 family)